MKKPLVLSLAALAGIMGTTTLSAESMYERFEAMELKMQKLQQELDTLTNKVVSTKAAEDEEEEETEADEADDAQKTTVAANDEEDDEAADEEDEDSDEASEDDSEEDEDDDDAESIEDQIAEMQESITELSKNTNGSHLKFSADYRFAVDNLNYKMADGSTQKNDAFMTNRFWLNMNWKATDTLSFHGQLAYNKAFGARSDANTNSPTNPGYNFENFDWIANENAYDDVVRVRSVYFLYKNDEFIGADMPWTFSIGRRPSTNGHLVNLRDDEPASSPMGHNINVEFDGASAKFGLENIIGVDGMYLKFCAGRAMSNASHRFTAAPYAEDDNANPNIDLAGVIFVPYSDGQYSINTQYYYANNLIDQEFDYTINPPYPTPTQNFVTVGGMHAFTANFIANGIGDGISDYLDDTTFFISGAVNVTNPKKSKRMLYGMYNSLGHLTKTGESKTGYSTWVGLQMPSLFSEDGKWGLEYNWGSKYWRSITYGEDTNIGSKLATRGSAYEIYFTEYLVEEILSMQLRYTYVDYKFSGSNGFFGETTGASYEISDTMPGASNYVDTAQDIRLYIRYRF